jgi:hypothetical protein
MNQQDKIHQIYHVARCGSTLLTYMLSEIVQSYSEPDWAKSLLLGSTPVNITDTFRDTVVKFPSLVSSLPIRFNGNKVFLYRPLSQHLCKIKSVDPIWIRSRANKINQLLKNNTVNPLLGEGIFDELDAVARIWILSVFQMRNTDDVLWLETNDLFTNKKDSVIKVCKHFGLSPTRSLHDTMVDVKKSRFVGHNDPLNKVASTSQLVYTPYSSYGIIETHLALLDDDTMRRVDSIAKTFPEVSNLLY